MDPASPIRSPHPLIILAGSCAEVSSVALSLREIGCSCVCAPDYRTFEQQARVLKPDLMVLDSGVTEDFFGDAKRREEIESIPAIHLVSTAADRAQAFAAGAVDCVVKPILLEELMARVQARIELLQTQKQLPSATCNSPLY